MGEKLEHEEAGDAQGDAADDEDGAFLETVGQPADDDGDYACCNLVRRLGRESNK